ncbi:MAG: glycosyltransferase family 4 protein [Caldilineaceae bacterium]
MKLGIAIEETWDFFHEIYKDLSSHHQTSLFKRRTTKLRVAHTRINNYYFERDMRAFMQNNDVVYFEFASHLLEAASKLPKSCGIVTRLHRYEMYQFVDRINWDGVDRIILVAQAKKDEFVRRFPKQADKCVVVSPSTSLERFTFVDKPFQGDIGILCHLTPRKRVYDLITLFYELQQRNPDLHLHVAGGPNQGFLDYWEAIQFLVRKFNLQDKVTLYGNVKETQDWYHKIDLFISNSYNEGLQVAPMEAMASGCVCFSHHWDGAEELVPASNLFVGPLELSEKVLRYCQLSPSEQSQQRQAARAWAIEHFDIRKTVDEVRTLLEAVGARR